MESQVGILARKGSVVVKSPSLRIELPAWTSDAKHGWPTWLVVVLIVMPILGRGMIEKRQQFRSAGGHFDP